VVRTPGRRRRRDSHRGLRARRAARGAEPDGPRPIVGGGTRRAELLIERLPRRRGVADRLPGPVGAGQLLGVVVPTVPPGDAPAAVVRDRTRRTARRYRGEPTGAGRRRRGVRRKI